MTGKVLITGGAGFIGSHLADALLARGWQVRVLDKLIEQVHGGRDWPVMLDRDVELVVGDVRDKDTVLAALQGIDSVIHLAAEVGVGQSMYAIDRYVSVNDHGTAVLLQALTEHPVRRVVVASSMSIYGEGRYQANDGAVWDAVPPRRPEQPGGWDPVDQNGFPLQPVPTPEAKPASLASVYAISKYAQERLVLTVPPAYGIESVALRLWNVYGPGQALSNPYTGVLAIFSSRLLNGKRPLIFEDGRQRRDFVHVADVVTAFLLALEQPAASGRVFNIASGIDRTVREVAMMLACTMGVDHLAPEITGRMRAGDIRHCIADIAAAKSVLQFEPRQDFVAGLAELAEWVARQTAEDRVLQARAELEQRGLVA